MISSGTNALISPPKDAISLTADEGLLRERLIARRIATGVQREDAVSFVDFSDMANVRLCLEKTGEADLNLEISQDGGIVRRTGGKPPRHTVKGDKA